MKTTIFGALMGLFGGLAVFLSISLNWQGWVLFLAWVCFYLYGKSNKKSMNVYLQILLGIVLSILIEFVGGFLTGIIGEMGLYLSIFFFIGSLAFLIKIKGLQDLTAWFIGLVVFFGVEPELTLLDIAHQLLVPLATGFAFGIVVDLIVQKYVFGTENTQVSTHG